MPTSQEIASGKAIQRRTGRTFHLATRFLPERIRHQTYVLYGFFRVADEVVDDAGTATPAEQREELDRIEAIVLGDRETDEPVLRAFREVRAATGIPDAEIERFLAAMRQDASTDRYETLADLEAYMAGSAVAVARMMNAVMDPADPETARSHADALGEAFQLTNFLRDVREDVLDRDRVYLPAEMLRRHGSSPAAVADLTFDEGVEATVRTLLAHTEARYRAGVAGIHHLPEDCQFPVLLSAVLYADHHRLIRKQGFDTVSKRPSLSRRRKLWLVARTGWHWLRVRDPEAVFWAVSAVKPPSAASPPPSGDPVPR